MNRSMQRFAIAFVSASSLMACAASGGGERPGAVTTTSATVGPSQCKVANGECYRDGDCCSGSCDYDNYYCH